MDNTFTFKNGTTVELAKVKGPALRHLIMKTGIRVNDPEELARITKLPKDEQAKALGMTTGDAWGAAQATEQLFSYLAGFGIKTNPPEDVREELVSMGLAIESDRAVRASWVRYLLIDDDDEAAVLTQAIISFAGQRDDQENGKH